MTVRPRTVLALATAVLATLTALTSVGPAAHAAASPRTYGDGDGGDGGGACSPRASVAGYSDALDKTEYQGTPVAGLSALARDVDGRIAALSDRSVLFSLDVHTTGGTRTARTTRAVPLADERGEPLDSEGLVVERDGDRLVTSETEPSVRRYDRAGTLLGRLPVPEALRVAPAGRARANQTFEGLTALRHGRTLTAALEGQLAGDGKDASGRPLVRMQSWDRARDGGFRAARQWGYPVDEKLGVAEIAATGDGRLLVLERGYEQGAGNTVRLYLADPRGADDVTRVGELTGQDGTGLVGKTLLADLGDCPDLGAPNPSPQSNPLLDNIEGLAVTGHGHGHAHGYAHGGWLRVLLVSDDNASATQLTRLYALTLRLPRLPHAP
ncbi:esterase-like activity of phytase family protein [Streptomyces daliensis]